MRNTAWLQMNRGNLMGITIATATVLHVERLTLGGRIVVQSAPGRMTRRTRKSQAHQATPSPTSNPIARPKPGHVHFPEDDIR